MDDNAPAFVCVSDRARSFFAKNYADIQRIATRAARRYGALAEDLIQEGFMVLLRAFEGDFDPGREDWRGYVKVVLERAIWHAYQDETRRRGPLVTTGKPGDLAETMETVLAPADETFKPDRRLVEREVMRERNTKRHSKMRRLRASLSPAEREVLELRTRPPADLLVMSRNLHGDDGSRHGARLGEVTIEDIARYTGASRADVKRRVRAVRVRCAELRG